MDHQRPLVRFRQRRLVGTAEVAAPFKRQPFGLEGLHRIVVGDARKRFLHRFELRQVTFEDLELALAVLEHASDDRDNQVLGEIHDVVQIGVGHLRLDHPELGQVAARLRLLGAEGRAEAVDPAERHRVGFVVELTALRQIRGLLLEVLRRKERRRPLARRRREDRRVGEDEAARVEEVAYAVDDLVADAQDRLLALAADPEMAAIEQVVDAVFLRGDRVVVRLANDLEVPDVDLVAARGALVGARGAGDDDRRLLREMVGGLEQLLADRGLRHHRLNEAAAVAHDQEMDLAARSTIVQPALDGDFLAFVLADLIDVCLLSHQRSAINRSIRSRAVLARTSVSFVEPRASVSKTSGPS